MATPIISRETITNSQVIKTIFSRIITRSQVVKTTLMVTIIHSLVPITN